MREKFFDKNVDYFWEYEYPFGEVFLKEIFTGYKRKYSLIGEGIYNLIFIDGKIYEIKFKKTTSMLTNDGKKALRDATKDNIVELICKSFCDNNIEYTVNSGKFITFKLGNCIAKIEIIKKTKEPE